MSDETFVIDTGSNLIKEDKVEPFPVKNENHPLLDEVIPEYTDKLPNQYMENLTKRLKMTMKLYGGIGLSANQCGVSARVFVIGTDHFQFVCINPKIIASSAELKKESEGCLSFPVLYFKIASAAWVDVEYTNEIGEITQVRLEGLTARCFLHELDHMNGIKFTKYVGNLAMKMAYEKRDKRIKRAVRQRKNK